MLLVAVSYRRCGRNLRSKLYTKYYSVTDDIFQLIVDFWHNIMLLVNDDDDVGRLLAFLYYSAMFCIFKYFYFCFILCVCVCV